MDSSVDSTPFDAFPAEVRQDLDGLIWLGYLREEVSFCGHTFSFRTLRGDEELLAGLVMKDYTETMGQAKAHVWATLSLALLTVDGREDFCSQMTPSKRDFAHARFNWITTNWYWPVALFLFGKYTELAQRQSAAMEALEDFCAGSLPTFTPFADSSITRASSEPEEDIRDYLEPQEGSTPPS